MRQRGWPILFDRLYIALRTASFRPTTLIDQDNFSIRYGRTLQVTKTCGLAVLATTPKSNMFTCTPIRSPYYLQINRRWYRYVHGNDEPWSLPSLFSDDVKELTWPFPGFGRSKTLTSQSKCARGSWIQTWRPGILWRNWASCRLMDFGTLTAMLCMSSHIPKPVVIHRYLCFSTALPRALLVVCDAKKRGKSLTRLQSRIFPSRWMGRRKVCTDGPDAS